MILTYSTAFRTETDTQIIATLLRKGWAEARMDVQLVAANDPRVAAGYPAGYPDTVAPLAAGAVAEHIEMTQAEVEALRAQHAAALEAYHSRPFVPRSVTRRQLFLWLLDNKGLTRAQLRAMINTEAGLIEFDEATSFDRDHPMVTSIATALAMTKADVDRAYTEAALL